MSLNAPSDPTEVFYVGAALVQASWTAFLWFHDHLKGSHIALDDQSTSPCIFSPDIHTSKLVSSFCHFKIGYYFRAPRKGIVHMWTGHFRTSLDNMNIINYTRDLYASSSRARFNHVLEVDKFQTSTQQTILNSKPFQTRVDISQFCAQLPNLPANNLCYNG